VLQLRTFHPAIPEEPFMTRKISLTAFAAAQCVLMGLVATAPVRAADIPQYFLKEWTVTSNCTEAHAGPAAKVQSGLKFSVQSNAAEGTYTLKTTDVSGQQWLAGWSGLKLEYRAGAKMTTLPADFDCVAGSEPSSSSFLAMSGNVQTAEPYYGYEHFYGLATLHGQLEHVLIFPRDTTAGKSAIVVLQSASASSDIKLDDDGTINAD
jgi:hypothetical protein